MDKQYTKVEALDILKESEGSKWVENLEKMGFHNILFRKMDVTNFDECQAVVSEIVSDFSRNDALINNAGITRDDVFHKLRKNSGMLY